MNIKPGVRTIELMPMIFPVIADLGDDWWLVAHPEGPTIATKTKLGDLSAIRCGVGIPELIREKAIRAFEEFAWPLVRGEFYTDNEEEPHREVAESEANELDANGNPVEVGGLYWLDTRFGESSERILVKVLSTGADCVHVKEEIGGRFFWPSHHRLHRNWPDEAPEPPAMLNWEPAVNGLRATSQHPGNDGYHVCWRGSEDRWQAVLGVVSLTWGCLEYCIAACEKFERSPDATPGG